MGEELQMMVSQVFSKNGKKYAFVSFTDGTRTAEGRIPECRIISNKGFREDEVRQLEEYMGRELSGLKKMAVGIRTMDALFES